MPKISSHKSKRDRVGDAVKRASDQVMNLETAQVMIQDIIKDDLPHLYGRPWYTWAWDFFQSQNRINLLVAPNQCGKSSVAVRKNIEWACNRTLWPELWPSIPRQFWYFYPSSDVANTEFEKKWIPELLPRGVMKTHALYGWEEEYNGNDIKGIHFNSGVSLYFKTYGQREINLQTATVHMITADEEMDPDYMNEIFARLDGAETRGYFNMVFTATMGYPFWFQAMECIGKPEETLKGAWKRSVSLYDSQTYRDGSPSPWTMPRIKERESRCTSKNEILKRVHGRFVRDEGLMFPTFAGERNIIKAQSYPKDWRLYGGVNTGKDKEKSSPALIFILVNPEMTKGRITKCWREDHNDIAVTDILDQFIKLLGKEKLTQASYDHVSKEFGAVASHATMPFTSSDRLKDSGVQTVNLLFKTGALSIDDEVFENYKLVTELMSVPSSNTKKFQSGLVDALRHVVMLVPWDFGKISGRSQPVRVEDESEAPDPSWTNEQYTAWEIRRRRGEITKKSNDSWRDMEDDIEYWNSQYEGN